MPLHDVLQRGGDKKVLLSKPQLLPGRRFVARIENFRDRFRPLPLRRGRHMLALVECVEPHWVSCTRGPQSQRIHVATSPADDWSVVRNRFECLVGLPDGARDTPWAGGSPHAPPEMDVVDHLWPFESPRIAE